jgi:ribonucleoside-diphosphate reductase alpha chain
MPDVNPDFVRMAEEGGWYSDELMERIAEEGHIHFDEVPEEVQRIFRTAHDITPEWHVRMQAAFQEHTDSRSARRRTSRARRRRRTSARSTSSRSRLGCKGVTVYRDGSREGQVLSTGKTSHEGRGGGRGGRRGQRSSSTSWPTRAKRRTTCASRSSG